MNPILQFAAIVIVGTAICAFGTLGMLLLCMRIQNSSSGALEGTGEAVKPAEQNRNAVVFEVEGKLVALHIDVGDAPVSGLRIQR